MFRREFVAFLAGLGAWFLPRKQRPEAEEHNLEIKVMVDEKPASIDERVQRMADEALEAMTKAIGRRVTWAPVKAILGDRVRLETSEAIFSEERYAACQFVFDNPRSCMRGARECGERLGEFVRDELKGKELMFGFRGPRAFGLGTVEAVALDSSRNTALSAVAHYDSDRKAPVVAFIVTVGTVVQV